MTNFRNQHFLYELIYEMSSSEKRYFKIHSRNHTIGTENHYLRLFDMIVGMQKTGPVVNERSLRTEFALKYKKNRFDLYKSNLYKKLLQSLEAFHRSSSYDLELRSKINHANILHKKGLPLQSLSLIRTIKSLCLQHEKWYMMLEILELERNITYAIQKPPIENREELDILQKVVSAGHFRNVQSEVWKTYITVGLPTDEQTLSNYTRLKENSIFQVSTEKLTLETRMLRLYCLQFLSGMEAKINETYDFGKELIELMESNPLYMSNKSELYIRTLINLQYAQIRLNKLDEVLQSIKKCKSSLRHLNLVPAFKNSITIALFINHYDILFKNKKKDGYKKIIEEMQLFFNLHSHEMGEPTLLLYYWQNAIHCFNTRNYAEALDWTESINEIKSLYRVDIQAFAKILNLIIHFELDNRDALKYFALNTFRYLKRKERLLPIENILINFIRKNLIKRRDSKSALNAFEQVKHEIQVLKKGDDSHEALLLMYFEHWIDQKLNPSRRNQEAKYLIQ